MSIDTSAINLLDLLPSRLTKVASTGGGEWHGACPFCGGTDRFIVHPNQSPAKWWCRGCERSGDAIAFLQQYHNLPFTEAVERLGLESQLKGNQSKAQSTRPQWQPANMPAAPTTSSASQAADSIPAVDNPEYIEKSKAFVEWSWNNLQSKKYPEISDYLASRGIDMITADLFMLGYNPYSLERNWGDIEVKLFPGIVIPYLDGFEGIPRKIKIRRMGDVEKKFRYIAIKGGANWLFNAWQVKPRHYVVLTEGEIDAISVAVGCPHHEVISVATGSTMGARWMRWVALLAVARKVLIAFDDDESGEKATQWWAQYLLKAKDIRPTAHDINDMLTKGHDIGLWIEKAIS